MSTNKSSFILEVVNFLGNPHDGKTLIPALAQAGIFGDILNLIFSSAAFNLNKLLNWLKSQPSILFYCLFMNLTLLFYREKQSA